ncbi:ribosomal RNA small subunit methyltransferase E [Spirochaetia bacterium]|nr:ribosomal RNA small subunit methyltransferase E [Spirochaetia bacterium]
MNLILFEDYELGKPLSRRDERAVHLLKVLHKKAGDTFDAGVLGGDRGTGAIEAVRLDGIFFTLDLNEEPPKRTPIRIAVGFPRPIQLRRLLRDLANLGVETVDLVGTELGEKSYRNTKLLDDGGARAAMVEGAAQARDTRLPVLTAYPDLEDWLRDRPWDRPLDTGALDPAYQPGPVLIAADNVRSEGSLANLTQASPSAVLTVGSERGWSDRERDLLEDAGFVRLSMGSRALRTETACVAAAILIMEKLGELG